MSLSSRILVLGLLVSCAVISPAAVAQSTGPQRATRAELQSRITTLEQEMVAGTRKASSRTAATAEIAGIRSRLQTGDFRVGDRFILYLRQETERTDTVMVRDSMKASIANLPEMSLSGVLRSELEDRVSAHVARFLRNASVRTSLLTRVVITGAVGRPGFYYVAPDRPVNDMVAVAGGPVDRANLDQLTISRGSQVLLSAKSSTRAVKEGRTLEALDVQSGDEIRVPSRRKINWQLIIQMFFIASSLFFAFIQFLQWYYNRKDA